MMKKSEYKGIMIITSIMMLIPVVVGVILWDKLPNEIATHFGADNQANGWSSKPMTVFGMYVESVVRHVNCAEKKPIESDIQGLSIQELNYAKNEIYARHGRMFDSPELQNYFNSKQWYEGKYSAEDFDANYSASLLSDTEKKNTEFLKDAEYKLSSSGYQLDQ